MNSRYGNFIATNIISKKDSWFDATKKFSWERFVFCHQSSIIFPYCSCSSCLYSHLVQARRYLVIGVLLKYVEEAFDD